MSKDHAGFQSIVGGKRYNNFRLGWEVENAIEETLHEHAMHLQSSDPDPDCWYGVEDVCIAEAQDDVRQYKTGGPIRALVTASIVRFRKDGDAVFGYGRYRDFVAELLPDGKYMKLYVRPTDGSLLSLGPAEAKGPVAVDTPLQGDLSFDGEGFLC